MHAVKTGCFTVSPLLDYNQTKHLSSQSFKTIYCETVYFVGSTFCAVVLGDKFAGTTICMIHVNDVKTQIYVSEKYENFTIWSFYEVI